jgi:hypothetical protein
MFLRYPRLGGSARIGRVSALRWRDDKSPQIPFYFLPKSGQFCGLTRNIFKKIRKVHLRLA